jgi:hypothetical protein
MLKSLCGIIAGNGSICAEKPFKDYLIIPMLR